MRHQWKRIEVPQINPSIDGQLTSEVPKINPSIDGQLASPQGAEAI